MLKPFSGENRLENGGFQGKWGLNFTFWCYEPKKAQSRLLTYIVSKSEQVSWLWVILRNPQNSAVNNIRCAKSHMRGNETPYPIWKKS